MHYGLTEVSRAIFCDLHEDDLTSVGKISRGADVKIIGSSGAELTDGAVGEIALKADWVCSGYYQNHELNSESFIDGYFRTGDLGYCSGGNLYLSGRLAEQINVGGRKFNPLRVEELVNKLDFVVESACIGEKNQLSGEIVVLFIVLDEKSKRDESTAESTIRKSLADLLPVYMRPSRFQFLNELPKTSTGKLKRLELSGLKS